LALRTCSNLPGRQGAKAGYDKKRDMYVLNLLAVFGRKVFICIKSRIYNIYVK